MNTKNFCRYFILPIMMVAVFGAEANAKPKKSENAKVVAKSRKPASHAPKIEALLKKNQKNFIKFLAGSKCFSSANDLLREWGVLEEWYVRPTNMDGGKSFASPTRETGVWVEAVFYPNKSVELIRQSPDAALQATWTGDRCEPKARPFPRGPVMGDSFFTDQDLAAIRKSGQAAVVYTWSPHMPLSVGALKQLQEIAAKLKVTFVPVLDPNADKEAVEAAVKENDFSSEAKRRARSIEMAYRGVHLHYPSTLVISTKGDISGLYPGVWDTTEAIEKFIKENR